MERGGQGTRRVSPSPTPILFHLSEQDLHASTTQQLQVEDEAAKIAAGQAAEEEKSEKERIGRNTRRRETRAGRTRAHPNPIHDPFRNPVADPAIFAAAKAEKQEVKTQLVLVNALSTTFQFQNLKHICRFYLLKAP